MNKPPLYVRQHESSFDAVLQGVASGLVQLIPVPEHPKPISIDPELAVPLPVQQQADAGMGSIP